MIVGFIGTGTITSAIVTGLSSEGGPGGSLRLSPRNSAIAAGLAGRFPNVSVCSSNQNVLDVSEVVVIAVRPQVAAEVLSALHFSAGHVVISLVPGFPVSRLAGLVAPAARISRAIPLPSASQRRSPIALYPPGGPAAELFDSLGQVFGIEAEDHLNVFSTATSTMAAYFGFAGRIVSWMERKGIPAAQARGYLARMFAGLAEAGLEKSAPDFGDLAAAHATPGGLNEQVLRDLTAHGAFHALTEALDSVHRRATGHSD